jgi:hypothetical protein
MATDKQTSEQGTGVDRAIVRDFLLTALEHDAATDRVHDLVYEHAIEGKHHPSAIAARLEPIISEVLGVATSEDWRWVADTFIEQAREAFEVESPLGDDTASTDQSSDTSEVIDVGTPPLTAARRLLRNVCNQGGAVYIESAQGNEYEGTVVLVMRSSVTLHDRRTDKPATIRLLDIKEMTEVDLGVSDLFVKPLASGEVQSLKFILPNQQTGDLDARSQAEILLGSNAGCTASQIAAMLAVDESKVCQVITDANERGFAGVLAARRAEREHVITTARDLDRVGFNADTHEARPGKYQGAGDLQLVVALDIINGHGFADENTGDAAASGYAWRVNRFVGIEDSQGFVTAEEWPTPRHAEERLRDFDAIDDADEKEA